MTQKMNILIVYRVVCGPAKANESVNDTKDKESCISSRFTSNLFSKCYIGAQSHKHTHNSVPLLLTATADALQVFIND